MPGLPTSTCRNKQTEEEGNSYRPTSKNHHWCFVRALKLLESGPSPCFSWGSSGNFSLAGGSLAIGVANINGIFSHLRSRHRKDGIASQAFGARNSRLPLSHSTEDNRSPSHPLHAHHLLWFNFEPVLIHSGQNSSISSTAITYLRFSIPTLLFSVPHPPHQDLPQEPESHPPFHAQHRHLPRHSHPGQLRRPLLSGPRPERDCTGGLLGGLHYSDHPSGVSLFFWPSYCEVSLVLARLCVVYKQTRLPPWNTDPDDRIDLPIPCLVGPGRVDSGGDELGADRPKQALMASVVCIGMFYFHCNCFHVFHGRNANVWGRMFTSDPAIISLVASVLPVVGLCELGNCPQTTVCGVLRGCARPTLAAYINCGSFYGVGLPAALALGFGVKLGLLGMWLGLLAAQLVCFGLMVGALLCNRLGGRNKQIER
ncbi:hypothetical protein M0R45_004449 [Rubus argutus]|uniref:Uncharacterized protein n=1 Tax=Rubus argutus TaxID=59490 RepID=A0AAW1YKB1_RUBAR